MKMDMFFYLALLLYPCLRDLQCFEAVPRSNSMAFVTSQLVTLGMIEQPVWLWYDNWNEQINIIT